VRLAEAVQVKRKLIEVAPFAPLDAISVASKADKDKKTGTIKNVHKWFAPMPTPALRALIFSALVDAPEDEAERDRLLDLVKRLVPKDGNPPDAKTLTEATDEIRRSNGGELPTIFDPFCGGGSTLIEAQRLGLPAMGSDLNPVPVLITRTLTQLIPQVAGRPPLVGDTGKLGSIGGGPLDGLFADVQHYAELVRERVWSEVGHLYPPGPNGETILAWLWARTVDCPNPACGSTVPLISSTWLSKRKGSLVWVEPVVVDRTVKLRLTEGPGSPTHKGTVSRSGGATCLVCGEKVPFAAIRAAGSSRSMGIKLLALSATRDGDRTFIDAEQVSPEEPSPPENAPDALLAGKATINLGLYGFETQADLYTSRQLVTLDAFAKAIAALPNLIQEDGGDVASAAAITSILGLALGKLAQSNSSQVRWKIDSRNGTGKPEPGFGLHAMPMVWDFSETNPFGGSVGDWLGQVGSMVRGLARLPTGAEPSIVRQADARSTATKVNRPVVVITDPPYFDQIGYADLSDFFYVWHRQALRRVHPDLYGTIVTPKDEELIATPHRHEGRKEAAAHYFVDGFTETFRSLKTVATTDHPVLIVYAHRQEESSSLGSASTGWDAMLEAVLAAGLNIEGTLPIRGTGSTRQIGQGTNALASYIVMVCRPRTDSASPGTIADFRAALRTRLPDAADALLGTGESMVDIRQAAIGPGMEVFSQFSAVFDGSEPITVRRALSIINEELGRILDEHLGAVDDETRWACQWYVDHQFEQGEYDRARQLAQTFGLGVDGLAAAGIVEQGRSKVRLLDRSDLPADWMGDDRTPAWEACQHLAKRLGQGEQAAGELLAALGAKASGVRELAQYLTNLAIEKGWSDDAIAYDALVKSWPRIEELALRGAEPDDGQLF
jgi:putative DNA methylase